MADNRYYKSSVYTVLRNNTSVGIMLQPWAISSVVTVTATAVLICLRTSTATEVQIGASETVLLGNVSPLLLKLLTVNRS